MELRRVDLSVLDLSLSRLRQLPEAEVRVKEESLRSKGQLTPLVAAETDGRLVLVDGFVRHLAATRLGLDSVLVEVVQLSPVQMKAQVYLRNRERGLALIEECRLVRELVEVDRLSQVEVGDVLERHKSWVSRRLQLSRQVSSYLLGDVAVGLLGEGSLRKLALLPPRNQEELWAAAQREGLSPRDTRRLVDLWQRAPDPESRRYLLEHPGDAVERSRGTPPATEDPRLGSAGRELLTGLNALRRTSLRVVARVRDGLGELPEAGRQQLADATERARGDCHAALLAVTGWLTATRGVP
jgi:ParB-like chromosome segregation protein Spo0J